mmetsp:Transcript_32673/g.97484  ORF Transcript_32673/g.97484 Transcript_32673/m.97484 type:complete len:363 (+) Transcript_32673:44-1132(+)
MLAAARATRRFSQPSRPGHAPAHPPLGQRARLLLRCSHAGKPASRTDCRHRRACKAAVARPLCVLLRSCCRSRPPSRGGLGGRVGLLDRWRGARSARRPRGGPVLAHARPGSLALAARIEWRSTGLAAARLRPHLQRRHAAHPLWRARRPPLLLRHVGLRPGIRCLGAGGGPFGRSLPVAAMLQQRLWRRARAAERRGGVGSLARGPLRAWLPRQPDLAPRPAVAPAEGVVLAARLSARSRRGSCAGGSLSPHPDSAPAPRGRGRRLSRPARRARPHHLPAPRPPPLLPPARLPPAQSKRRSGRLCLRWLEQLYARPRAGAVASRLPLRGPLRPPRRREGPPPRLLWAGACGGRGGGVRGPR